MMVEHNHLSREKKYIKVGDQTSADKKTLGEFCDPFCSAKHKYPKIYIKPMTLAW